MNISEIQTTITAFTKTPEYRLTDILGEIDKTSGPIKTLYRAALFAESENNTEMSLCDVHAPSDTYLLQICNQKLSEMYQKISEIASQLRDERKAPVLTTDTEN